MVIKSTLDRSAIVCSQGFGKILHNMPDPSSQNTHSSSQVQPQPHLTTANFAPSCLTTTLGSLPHTDVSRGSSLMFTSTPEIPSWVQFPKRDFHENMMMQFTEGLPGLVQADDRVTFDTSAPNFVDPRPAFDSHYLAVTEEGNSAALDSFSLSRGYAPGFYEFVARLPEQPVIPVMLKGQVTGPFTLGTNLLDQDRRCAYYDEQLRDVVVKSVAMKALWQLECLAPWGAERILFVDEPILAAFGSSAYINLTREQAVDILEENFSAVKSKGALVGRHCCGNTDWSLMVDAGVDIINFDAYVYMDSIGLYAESLAEFLDRGGYLAWGIVPSQSLDVRPGPEELLEMLRKGIDGLSEKGVSREKLLTNLLITTSCGLGTLTEEEAEAALRELQVLRGLVRENLAAQV